MIRILVTLTMGLTLVSCTASSRDPASTEADEFSTVSTPAVTPSTSGRSGDVERDFLRRPTLPSCGTIDLPNGSRADREDRDHVECFREGMVSTAGAELAVVNYTVEGAPSARTTEQNPTPRVYLCSSTRRTTVSPAFRVGARGGVGARSHRCLAR